MATRDQRYRVIGVVLCVVGGVLVALAIAQQLFDLTLFRESPLLVGSAVGFIGALLAAGGRRGASRRDRQHTSPRS